MMKRVIRRLLAVCMVIVSLFWMQTPVNAATRPYKDYNQNNPIATHRYSADPGVMVYNDTVYIYCTNDGDRASGYSAKNEYGQINTLVCFSSKDLVNWTDHGTIPVAGRNGIAKWANNSWAPYAVHKTINGKEKFFLYFANNGSGVGVLTADSPTGPWTDPIGRALVTGATPNCNGVPWCFDPAAFVDDDGTGYLYFGGGVPNGQDANPRSLRAVKLGDDMTSLAGTPVVIDAPCCFEDSGINKIGNTYYYSYCSNWNTGGRMSNAAIEYMTSNNPLGPFTYRGELFKNPGVFFSGSTGTNHHTIFNFKGNYYLAYHTMTLEKAANNSTYGYRSTHIDRLPFSNGSFGNVTGTMAGVSQVGTVNPYQQIQAETMSNQGGIVTTNLGQSGNTIVTDIGNGDWTCVKGVNFNQGLSSITVSVRTSSSTSMKVYTGSPTGTLLGTIQIPNTGNQFREVTGNLSNLTGVKDVYFVFDGRMEFDYWSAVPQGVQPTVTPTPTDEPTPTPIPGEHTLPDGWYYIKSVHANKYLQVQNNIGANGTNVEIGTGTGAQGQKWQLVNETDGYVTLKNGKGFMLDIAYGRDEDATNVQTYEANGMDAQLFKLVATDRTNTFGIVTKCSSDTKGLDVANKSTDEGANVIQYSYWAAANQIWTFEPCNGSSTPTPTVKPTETPTPTPTVKPTETPTPTPTEKPTETPTPTPTVISKDDVLEVNVISDWGSGATVEFIVTNTTGHALNGWSCSFTLNRPIDALWNAEIAASTGATYTVVNPAWKADLAVGESFTFGGNLGSGPSTVVVTNAMIQ